MSTDGMNLTLSSIPSLTWVDAIYTNNLFLVSGYDPAAMGMQRLISSPDGINWTPITLPDAISGKMAAGNSIYLIFNIIGSSYLYSNDLSIWRLGTLPTPIGWVCAQVIHNGVYFLATSTNSDTYIISTDGVNWTVSSFPSSTSKNWGAITFGLGLFVTINYNANPPLSLTSSDGITWISNTMPLAGKYSKVIFGNGFFLALIEDSTYGALSYDGQRWSTVTLPYSSNWKNGIYALDMFIVSDLKNNQNYITSPCAKTPSPTPSGTLAWHYVISGLNTRGQLGLSDTSDRDQFIAQSWNVLPAAATDFPCISHGYDHTMLVKTDGGLYAYGNNDRGQLGLPTTMGSYISSPVLVSPGPYHTVSCGYKYTIAVAANGDIFGTGANENGQLGVGGTTDKLSFTQLIGYKSFIGVNPKVGSTPCIATGKTATVMVLLIKMGNGDLIPRYYSWGLNQSGQLGQSNSDFSYQTSTPGEISNLIAPVQPAVYGGNWNNHFFALALDSDYNHILCGWGANDRGQLGNALINISDPVLGVVSEWSNESIKIFNVAIGQSFTAFIAQTQIGYPKKLLISGANDRGQIGVPVGNSTNVFTEVPLPLNYTDWESICAGSAFIFATAIGTGKRNTFGWGDNTYGQLDGGPTAANNYASPTLLDSRDSQTKNTNHLGFGFGGYWAYYSDKPSDSTCAIRLKYNGVSTRIGSNGLSFAAGDTITVAGIVGLGTWSSVNGVYKVINFDSTNGMIVNCVSTGCLDGWDTAGGPLVIPITLGRTITSTSGAVVSSTATSGNLHLSPVLLVI